MALKIASLPKEQQRKLLKEEKLTLDRIETGCRSYKLETLLKDHELFAVPSLQKDPLEEAQGKDSLGH